MQPPSLLPANADVEKYTRVVPLAEIEQNDGNLDISRYVHISEEEATGRRVGGRTEIVGAGARACGSRGEDEGRY